VIAGYPIVDVKVTIFDGSYHDVDSNEMAFKIAGSMASKRASASQTGAARTDHEGRSGDSGRLLRRHRRRSESRRGQIIGMEDSPSGKVVTADVPLAEMFQYSTAMRSMSQGRANYTMEFAKYMEVPSNVADVVMKKAS